MGVETKAIKIGILGLGNIGAGRWRSSAGTARSSSGASGVPFELARAADRDPSRAQKLGLRARRLHDGRRRRSCSDPEVQVVVELIGGIEPARSLILAAMENGKHVVTANKALLSTHWEELVTKAEQKRVSPRLRGERRRRHPAHPLDPARPRRQPDPARHRDHQRDLQLHPHAHGA